MTTTPDPNGPLDTPPKHIDAANATPDAPAATPDVTKGIAGTRLEFRASLGVLNPVERVAALKTRLQEESRIAPLTPARITEASEELKKMGITSFGRRNIYLDLAEAGIAGFDVDETLAGIDPEAVVTLPKRAQEYTADDIAGADEAKLDGMYAENRMETIRRAAFRKLVANQLQKATEQGEAFFTKGNEEPIPAGVSGSERMLRQALALARANDPADKQEFLRLCRVNAITKLAFRDSQKNSYNRFELTEIFNNLRLLSAYEDEVQLYRKWSLGNKEPRFTGSASTREYVAFALVKTGRAQEAIELLEALKSGPAQAQNDALIYGAAGEAADLQAAVAGQCRDIALRAAAGETFPKGEIAQTEIRFIRAFQGKKPVEFPLAFLLEDGPPDPRALERAAADFAQTREDMLSSARYCYETGFAKTGSSYLGLELHRALLERNRSLAERGESGTPEQERNAVLLETLPRLNSLMIRKEGGEEAQLYWTHSSIVVNTCLRSLSEPAAVAELDGALDRAFRRADSPGKLKTTRADLERIRAAYAAEGAAPETLAGVTYALKRIDEEIARFNATGTPLPNGFSEKTPANDPYRYMKERTYGARGLVNPINAYYLPGGTFFGARVPDYIFSREDQQVCTEKIVQWGIPEIILGEEGTLEERLDKVRSTLIGNLRQELKTYKLQSLQSAEHKEFDDASQSQIAFSGNKKGNRALTNLFLTLETKVADCRENGKLFTVAYATFEHLVVDALGREALSARLKLGEEGRGEFERLTAMADALLSEEVRFADVGMFAEAQMIEKYKTAGYDPANPAPLRRGYGRTGYESQEPVTDYELWSANVRVTYADGTVQVLSPSVKGPDGWTRLPHKTEGGKAHLELDALFRQPKGNIADIQLLPQLEDHTMTMVFTRDGKVRYCDIFYNENDVTDEAGNPRSPEQLSPHKLGSGEVDLEELRETGFFSAPTELRDAGGNLLPGARVYMNFLGYSAGQNRARPTMGENGTSRRALGIPVGGNPASFGKAIKRLTHWKAPAKADIGAAARRLLAARTGGGAGTVKPAGADAPTDPGVPSLAV